MYALWRLNKKILFLLIVSFLATSASAAFEMGKVLSIIVGAWILSCYQSNFTNIYQPIANAITIPNGLFCVPFGVPHTFYRFWIPPLAFETLLCSLVMIRAVRTYMVEGAAFRSARNLIFVLIRDSVLYYVAQVFCAIIVDVGNNPYQCFCSLSNVSSRLGFRSCMFIFSFTQPFYILNKI